MNEYDLLKLEYQLSFPLYACSKEMIRMYTTLLNEIDLTYTQYITMMVIWEKKEITVKELGERLYLDSGTLTPLLKKLEVKGLVERKRDIKDERNVIISVTEKGMQLKETASSIPHKAWNKIPISPEDGKELYRILYDVLNKFKDVK